MVSADSPTYPDDAPAAGSGVDPELASALRLAVGRLARRMRRESSSGRALTQLGVLNTLDRLGPRTLGDLAAVERVAPPTITRAVGALESEGLVAKHLDESDRRVQWAKLTAAGRREVHRIRSRREAWLAERLATVAEADRDRLRELIHLLEAISGEECAAPTEGRPS